MVHVLLVNSITSGQSHQKDKLGFDKIRPGTIGGLKQSSQTLKHHAFRETKELKTLVGNSILSTGSFKT